MNLILLMKLVRIHVSFISEVVRECCVAYCVAGGTDLEMKPLTQTESGHEEDQSPSKVNENGYSEFGRCEIEV